jgi:MerR family transcriptional regulator, light-induced transcriptional regulator
MMNLLKPSKAVWESFMADPETYLKTSQVADALGVSTSSIKRWVDAGAIEATRTMGKHRLVALSSALRFARKENFPLENLLAMERLSPDGIIDSRMVDRLTEILKVGQALEVYRLIASAFHSTGGAVALADHLIRPVMERIGHSWMVGSWDVHHEHQATQMVSSAINGLIGNLSRESHSSRPIALGASPEGDPYTLAGLLGELVLRESGWDVRNLGANLPLRSLANAVREYRPKLVFLSSSYVVDRHIILRDYPYFYEAASQVGSAIMLGGRGLDLELRSNLLYAGVGERMAHLAEFARRLLPSAEANLGPALNTTPPMDTRPE